MSKYSYCKNKRTVNSIRVPRTEEDLIKYVLNREPIPDEYIIDYCRVFYLDELNTLHRCSFSINTTSEFGDLLCWIYVNHSKDSVIEFQLSDLPYSARNLIKRWTNNGKADGTPIEAQGVIEKFYKLYNVQYKLLCDFEHVKVEIGSNEIKNNYHYILSTADNSPLIPKKYLEQVQQNNLESIIYKHCKDDLLMQKYVEVMGAEYFYDKFIELTGVYTTIVGLKNAIKFNSDKANDLRIEHGYFTRVVVEKEIVEKEVEVIKEVKVPEPILKADYKIQDGMDKTISALKDLYMKYYGITLSRPRNQFESNIDSMYRILGLDIANEDDVYVAVVDILPRMFENYEKLGYSSTQFPKLCIGSLAVAWVVTGLNEGFPPKY